MSFPVLGRNTNIPLDTPPSASNVPIPNLLTVVIPGAFIFLLLAAAYLGLSSIQIPQINDKVLHFVTFFLLTIAFYWILDTTRRRALNITLLVVTVSLGPGSEALQAFATSRQFDPRDIAANIVGSLCAIGLCTLYHKRMLDRKRVARYGLVPQEGDEEIEDLEMGPRGGQDNGVTASDEAGESTDGDGRLTPSSGGDGDVGTMK